MQCKNDKHGDLARFLQDEEVMAEPWNFSERIFVDSGVMASERNINNDTTKRQSGDWHGSCHISSLMYGARNFSDTDFVDKTGMNKAHKNEVFLRGVLYNSHCDFAEQAFRSLSAPEASGLTKNETKPKR